VHKPNEEGVIEQFDEYFKLEDASLAEVRGRLLDPKEYWGGAYGVAAHTQVIKQADVITMLEFFHDEYDVDTLQKNWDYYEPRTEHGSSLSACMYALVACRCGNPDRAYPFFLKSAKADWNGGGKQWAGLVYIGGTHPAAEGGAWKVLAEGFAGLECTADGPKVTPNLPTGWKRIAFNACCNGKLYRAELTPEAGTIVPVEG
jgi:kojibiose phosphorylase/nigerose phosphorylase